MYACDFSRCPRLKGIHIFGDAPLASTNITEIFKGAPDDLVVYVERSSTGWNGIKGSTDLPEAWNGRTIRYFEEKDLKWSTIRIGEYKGYYVNPYMGDWTMESIYLWTSVADETGRVYGRSRYQYTGTPISPKLTVWQEGVELQEGRDYTVSYSNNVNVGQAVVTIQGCGDYSGFASRVFDINPPPKLTVPVLPAKEYTGNLQTADIPESPFYEVVVNDGGRGAGTYEVWLELTNPSSTAWVGTADTAVCLDFTITQAENAWTTPPSMTGWTYGETAKVPSLGQAKFGTVRYFYEGEAYDGTRVSNASSVTKAGEYNAVFTVAGTANYGGLTNRVPFTVARAGIGGGGSGGSAVVTATGYTGVYDGQPHGISVSVTGSDAPTFTVKYAQSPEGPFSSTVPTFTGVTTSKVWYVTSSPFYNTATNSATVEIAPLQVTPPTLASKVYNGTLQKADVPASERYVEVANDGAINAGTNSVLLRLTDPVNTRWAAGTAGVLDGGFLRLSFIIDLAPIDVSGIAWDYAGPFTYDGAAHSVRLTGLPPGVTVKSYADDTMTTAGVFTATAVLESGANYAETQVPPLTWEIAPKSLAGATVALDGRLVHTGSPLTQAVAGVTTADGFNVPSDDYVVSDNVATEVGTYTLTVTGRRNYTGTATATFVVYTTAGKDLADDIGGLGDVEPDGDGWKVTLTDDPDGVVEIGDNLGVVTIDLKGHNLVGRAGATGDAANVPGGRGEPAIRIRATGRDGAATVLTIVDSEPDDTDDVVGGKGGDGTPGGDGGAAVQVAGGTKAGVKVNVGPSVGLRGGDGGRDLSGNSRGGNGGAGVDGNVGVNDGSIAGGAGGSSTNGRGGNGGAGVTGDVDVNNGTISGGDGGASETGRGGSGGSAVGGTVGGGSGTVTGGADGREPTIAVVDGGKSGALNEASVEVPYDRAGHGIKITVTEPAEGAVVRYALTRNGPFVPVNPLFTNVVDHAEVWYEVSAEGYASVTNWATVTVLPLNLRNAEMSDLRIETVNGVRTPRADLVYQGWTVPPDAYTLDWTESDEGAMTLTFTGRGNFVGTLVQAFPRTFFRVTYAYNGGSGDRDGDSYDMGTYYGTKLPRPVRPGYLFDGWYESPDFDRDTRVDRDTPVHAQDLTLYAKWLRRALWYTDTAFHLEQAAVWDGYVLGKDDVSAGTIQVKAGKPSRDGVSKITATVQLAGETKTVLKGTTFDGKLDLVAKDGRRLVATLTESGLAGTFAGMPLDGARNVFMGKDADSKLRAAQALRHWQGGYAAAVMMPDGCVVPVSVLVGGKGKVAVKGVQPDGKALAGRSQLLVGERECALAFSYTKKDFALAFLVWFCEDGSVELSNLHDARLKAVIGNQKAGAMLRHGSAFRIDGALIASDLGTGVLGELLPDGVPVAANGAKWQVARAGKVKLAGGELQISGDNPGALGLNYALRTSLFKGSFKIHFLEGGRLKSMKAAVNGVLVDGVGYGTATVKKPALKWPIRVE